MLFVFALSVVCVQVYGYDGWAFIEENSYRVLTEAILESEDQNQSDQDENHVDNQPDQDNENLIAENTTESTDGQQNQLVEPVQQCHEQVQSLLEMDDAGKEVSVKEMTQKLPPTNDAFEMKNRLSRKVSLLFTFVFLNVCMFQLLDLIAYLNKVTRFGTSPYPTR